MSDADDVSNEKPIPRVVVDQVFKDSKEYMKVLKDKGSHFLEPNAVVYPRFKDFEDIVYPNQVFVTKGNGDTVALELNKLVNEDNVNVTDEGFYSNKRTIKNGLNKYSKVFQNKTKTCLGSKNRKICY